MGADPLGLGPINHFYGSPSDFDKDSAILDTTIFSGPSYSWMKYNLIVPTVEVGADYQSRRGFISDEYALLGSGSEPITFRADFIISLLGARSVPDSPSSYGEAALEFGEVRHAQILGVRNGLMTQTVSLYLTHARNENFQIFWSAYAQGSLGSGRARGTFQFAELPSGVSIVSCRGFRYDAPVPVEPTTWGRIKATWR